ncbi:MAG: hypothetical protein NC242_11755 [Roseburia sp.]|nr:hypothetical protein [Roseburia sp.]
MGFGNQLPLNDLVKAEIPTILVMDEINRFNLLRRKHRRLQIPAGVV